MSAALLLWLLLPSAFPADACFEGRFCSQGGTPKNIVCARGMDCTAAPDGGLQFKKACVVSWFRGDAGFTEKYSVRGTKVTVAGSSHEDPPAGRVYELISDGGVLRSVKDPNEVYSKAACK